MDEPPLFPGIPQFPQEPEPLSVQWENDYNTVHTILNEAQERRDIMAETIVHYNQQVERIKRRARRVDPNDPHAVQAYQDETEAMAQQANQDRQLVEVQMQHYRHELVNAALLAQKNLYSAGGAAESIRAKLMSSNQLSQIPQKRYARLQQGLVRANYWVNKFNLVLYRIGRESSYNPLVI
jgi:hypothetical protein